MTVQINNTKSGGNYKMNKDKIENKINPLVGLVMGSESDLKVMKMAAQIMEELKIPYEIKVVSAHRTPQRMYEYSNDAEKRGLEVIIAGAGGAAHLPGMISSMTLLPVIGVPVKLKELDGMDSLLSIVQMPGGVPVATVGINNAKNAGILAARILGTKHKEIRDRLNNYITNIKENVIYDLEDKLAESWSVDNEKTK